MAKKKMAKKKMTGKGNAGSPGNGSRTRAAIRAAMKKGYTLAEIGRRVNRSASTLQNILSGDIKNPPNDLDDRIRSLPAKKRK